MDAEAVTANELIIRLMSLPEEQRKLPVCFFDEHTYREVISIEHVPEGSCETMTVGEGETDWAFDGPFINLYAYEEEKEEV